MILRPYQSAASDAIFKEWQEYDSTLVVIPTGGGKTVLFADVIRRVFPRRALVLAHREELIFQARDKIQRVRTGARGGLDHPDAMLGRRWRRADGEVRSETVRRAHH